MFERIDVLPASDYTFTLTAGARARGWDAAFGPGVVHVEADGQFGRGERIGADTFQLSVRIVGGSLDNARVERTA